MLRTATALVLACAALLAVPAPAEAAGGPDIGGHGNPQGNDDTASTDSSGGGVAVTVTSTQTVGGRPVGGSTTVKTTVAPLCWYMQGKTGYEYYEFWKDGSEELNAHTLSDYKYQGLLPKGWDNPERAVDKEGHWYMPICSYKAPKDLNDAYQKRDWLYVEGGDSPPAAAVEVDPRELLQAMTQYLKPAAGTIGTNPALEGSGATIVAAPTWVWLEGAPTDMEVTASVPSGTFARVNAKLAGVTVSADGAQSVRCDGPGIPWSAAAERSGAEPCAITFQRSSANQPGQTSTLDVTARWTGTWYSSIDPNPVPLPQPIAPVRATREVPVVETQSIVTG